MLVFRKDILNEVIEKALRGSQRDNHKYIFRREVAEKASGKSIKRYEYIYENDRQLRPIEMLKKFFGIGRKEIDDGYEYGNIRKDFGADKQTFAQHLVEYFSHRSIWDKRFSKKDNQHKFKKPVKMHTFKENLTAIDKEMETPEAESTVPELFTEKETQPQGEKAWKANPYLMRKIWGMYTGKTVEQNEKQEKTAKETLVANRKFLEEYYKNSVGGMTIQDVKDGKAHIIDLRGKGENRSEAMKGNQNAKGHSGDKGSAFKFSSLTDREKAEMGKRIQSSVVSSVESGIIKKTDEKSASKVAQEWVEKNFIEPANSFIGEVAIKKGNIKDSLAHGFGQDKLDAIPAIKDVLEKGTYLGYEYDSDGATIKNHYFAAKVNFPSGDKIVFCRVHEAEGDDTNRFYVHEVFTEDEIKKESSFQTSTADKGKKTGRPLYSFILRDILNVKEKPKDTKEEREKLIAKFAENYNLAPNVVENGFKQIDSILKKTEKKPTKAQLLRDTIKPQLREMGIIPNMQIEATNTEQIDNLKALLETIATMPKIGKGNYEAKLHYFVSGLDYYITELDDNGEAYGYCDNNGDPQMSEWGYIDLKELAKIGDLKGLNIDYHFKPKLVGDLIKENGHNELYEHYSDVFGEEEAKQKKHAEKESEAEARENRSNAMLGNQNAKKFGMPEDVYEIMRNMVSEQVNGQGVKNRQILFEKLYKKDEYFRNKLDLYGGTGNKETTGYNRSDIFNALYDDVTGDKNGEDNSGTGRDGISAGTENIRSGRGEESSNSDVRSAGSGADGNKSDFMPTEPRGRLGESDSDVDRGRGRITKGQARKIREQCREILKKPDSQITAEDKAVLAQYVGAGGTDEEGSSNSGVLYEFYTPRNVISKVWELVDKYNPKQDKTVIEPSSGIGRFAEGRSEKFTMFELEEASARIAHILHPDAEIVQGAFQENFMKNKKGRFTKDFEKFDVAVGNPPYGAYTGKYKGMGEGKDFKRYETYFMARTLDTLKDGGVMAMVVPSGFLNGGSTYGKDLEKIAEKAELLEAWRLPNGTFESTDVGTDIVVFRKGKGTNVDALKNYFANNPQHIAGEIATRIGRFGEETYIKPKDGETFESAVANIEIGQSEFKEAVNMAAEKITVNVVKEEGKPITSKTVYGDIVKTKDGKTGKVTGYITNNRKVVGIIVNVEGQSEEVRFTEEQLTERNAKTVSRSRSEAMQGNKNADGEHDYPLDPNAHLMDAAEFNKKYGKNIDPKDLPIWKVTDKYGNIDMTKLSEEEKKYIETSDHYVKEGDVYMNKVNYASGNVRKKLRELNPTDPQYEVKKALLEAVMPKEKGLLKTWKEKEIQTNEKGEKIEVEVEKSDGFTLSPIADWTRDYRTKDGKDLISGFFEWAYAGNRYYDSSDSPIARTEIPAILEFDDIKDFINKQSMKLERGEADTDDKKGKQRYREQKKQLRRDTATKLFNRYLSEGLSLDDQKDLVQAWNDKANAYVNPDYTQIPLFVDNMSTYKGKKKFDLMPQQMKGISMLCNKGTGLLAYDVGVGKTACGIVATVNQIQTGRSKRPLICVPKPVYKNWISSIHQLFPNIKVNELGNLSKNYWNEGIKIEDGSISVCTYEGLENIGFNEQEEAELQEDVEFGAMQTTGEKSKRKAASDSEKNAELVGNMSKTRDEGVMFSEMGFDHITVDEVHNFRNLFKAPRHMNKKGESEQGESNEFAGLGTGGQPSDRAMKLFAITQLIQRHNDGRNTFLLSATPFQNSPTEVYSILSYMARDKLKEQGFYSLEQFITNFCKVQSEYVVKANRVTEAPVVKGFENLSELQGLLQNYMDKVDGEEAGVVRPYKRMHAPELELTDLQKSIMDKCSAYIEQQEILPKDKRDDGYMFRAMNAMKFCALSPALVDPDFIPSGKAPSVSEVVETSPKLKFVCDSIIAQYKKSPQNGQIMYMPIGVEQHPQIKNYLIKHGIPKEAIEIMPKGTSEKVMDKREEIKDNFNNVDGKCKILIGGQDIKEGVTLNGNTTTIYCTQLDWNPTDVQQLWGRGWRQGNHQGIVHCVTLLMHDSLDPMIYQKHDEKSSRTDDLYSYKGDLMNSNDVNPEELKFALIKDPNKRADLQVMEFTEKNKSDQKMYGQLIDVLHKQIDVAFKDDKDLEKEAHYGITLYGGVEGEQKSIEENTQKKKELKELAAKLKKQFKDKPVEWLGKDKELYDKIDNMGVYFNRYSNDISYAISAMESKEANLDSSINASKHKIQAYNKNLKKLQGQRESCRAYLASKGMKTEADCEQKINDYVKLMDECRIHVEKAKDMREQFYTEAVAYNKANERNLVSVDELVKQNVDGIMNDLHPMDEEYKAKIKAENDARFNRGEVHKSWEYENIENLSKSIDEKQRAWIVAEKKVQELSKGGDKMSLYVAQSEERIARAELEDLQKSLNDAEYSLKKSKEIEESRHDVGYFDIQKSFADIPELNDKKPFAVIKDGKLFIKIA